MNISNTTAIYFSPTGTTEKVIRCLGDSVTPSANYIDITRMKKSIHKLIFSEQDLLIVGVPVYGGRVPAPAMARLRHLKGCHTPAVIVAVYGNRAYDDALLELKGALAPMGFHVIGAAAFIAEHSIVREIAPGRPDTEDEQNIRKFAMNVEAKLKSMKKGEDGIIHTVPGDYPYREYKGVPIHPKASKKCTNCGLCASKCPVGAISISNARVMKTDRCISCMRCIQVCPQDARSLSKIKYFVAKRGLLGKCRERREPEYFL